MTLPDNINKVGLNLNSNKIFHKFELWIFEVIEFKVDLDFFLKWLILKLNLNLQFFFQTQNLRCFDFVANLFQFTVHTVMLQLSHQ